MTDFNLPEGKNTPSVQFSASNGKLVIRGKSFPENSRKFYDEISQKLKEYSFNQEFSVELDLDYISSSSVISILDLLKKLKTSSASTEFRILFMYDEGDDDMQAIGENYSKILGIPFQYAER